MGSCQRLENATAISIWRRILFCFNKDVFSDLRAAELSKSAQVNQMGMTPLAAAQQNNQQQAMALLQRHGAK